MTIGKALNKQNTNTGEWHGCHSKIELLSPRLFYSASLILERNHVSAFTTIRHCTEQLEHADIKQSQQFQLFPNGSSTVTVTKPTLRFVIYKCFGFTD